MAASIPATCRQDTAVHANVDNKENQKNEEKNGADANDHDLDSCKKCPEIIVYSFDHLYI